uniref:Uncharacterized protein n=1 Tax=Arundo donax TaxID=35708 RepID=A0A0A9GKQ2_ARUDO
MLILCKVIHCNGLLHLFPAPYHCLFFINICLLIISCSSAFPRKRNVEGDFQNCLSIKTSTVTKEKKVRTAPLKLPGYQGS